jgi:hypothetical protein
VSVIGDLAAVGTSTSRREGCASKGLGKEHLAPHRRLLAGHGFSGSSRAARCRSRAVSTREVAQAASCILWVGQQVAMPAAHFDLIV